MNSIFVYSHTGLGDHLLVNAIIRQRATEYTTVFHPVKFKNLSSVAEMYDDLTNVKLVPVENDDEIHKLIQIMQATRIFPVEILGFNGKDGFKSDVFDQEFYRQAGVPFEDRWTKFKFPPKPYLKLDHEYAFVHDDPDRGMCITAVPGDPNLLPVSVKTGGVRLSIFEYMDLIECATEIHCIDSCFAILIDSLPSMVDKPKYIHRYARPGGVYPTYKNNWKIIA